MRDLKDLGAGDKLQKSQMKNARCYLLNIEDWPSPMSGFDKLRDRG